MTLKFVDLHTHFLPTIDDGPATFTETVKMLHIAYLGGTRGIVATPHMFLDPYNNKDPILVNDHFARTVAELRLRSKNPDFAFLGEMSLFLGSENYASPDFLEALNEGRVLPINGGRYLLVEFTSFLSPDTVMLVIRQVLAAGKVPVIAHAERSFAIQERPEWMSRFLDAGCISQINADSILGASGPRVRKVCLSLLSQNLVHVIASDGHRPDFRPPDLREVFLKLTKMYPPEQIYRWVCGNPSLIIENGSLANC